MHPFAPAAAVAALLALSGCAISVSGAVRDARTKGPIAGAELMANDGRDRTYLTDAAGLYAVKTDRDTATMTVTASGYQPTTVPIPAGTRFPVVFVNLRADPDQKKKPEPKPKRTTTSAKPAKLKTEPLPDPEPSDDPASPPPPLPRSPDSPPPDDPLLAEPPGQL